MIRPCHDSVLYVSLLDCWPYPREAGVASCLLHTAGRVWGCLAVPEFKLLDAFLANAHVAEAHDSGAMCQSVRWGQTDSACRSQVSRVDVRLHAALLEGKAFRLVSNQRGKMSMHFDGSQHG